MTYIYKDIVKYNWMSNHLYQKKNNAFEILLFLVLLVYILNHVFKCQLLSLYLQDLNTFSDFPNVICFDVLQQNLLVDELKLAEIGPKFEHHEVFPARTNTGQISLILWSEYHCQLNYDIFPIPSNFHFGCKGFFFLLPWSFWAVCFCSVKMVIYWLVGIKKLMFVVVGLGWMICLTKSFGRGASAFTLFKAFNFNLFCLQLWYVIRSPQHIVYQVSHL